MPVPTTLRCYDNMINPLGHRRFLSKVLSWQPLSKTLDHRGEGVRFQLRRCFTKGENPAVLPSGLFVLHQHRRYCLSSSENLRVWFFFVPEFWCWLPAAFAHWALKIGKPILSARSARHVDGQCPLACSSSFKSAFCVPVEWYIPVFCRFQSSFQTLVYSRLFFSLTLGVNLPSFVWVNNVVICG